MLAALALLLVPVAARAELTVSTLEGPSWPATVAALQSDVRAQGRTVHVVVADESGRRAACEEYSLSFDAAGATAFAVGACDPATRATPLVLVRRDALFSHDDVIAHPLQVAVAATQVRSGASSGGAADSAGTDVQCSVAVRPFLRDLLHGTSVYLTPGRFVLRVVGEHARGVTAAVDAQAWMLRGAASGALTVDYEVVDTLRGAVVLRDRATLACAVAPWHATGATIAVGGFVPAPPSPACADAEPLAVAGTTTVHGSTLGQPARFAGRCGNSGGAPERVYTVDVPERSQLALALRSDYDGVVYVRRACDDATTELGCNDDAGDTRHSALAVLLEPGRYYVVVDGYASAQGEYDLTATLRPDPTGTLTAPPFAAMSAPSGLGFDSPLLTASVSGTTANAYSQTGGSCGSSGTAPEVAYQFSLAAPAHVMLRLTSDYDGVLYVRDGASGGELGCNDDAGDTHHSALDLDLGPGTYLVFVDGYGGRAGAFTLRSNVPVGVGPLALAASRPHVRAEVGVGYAMMLPEGPWAMGQGFTAEVRGNVPFGGAFAFLFGGRMRTEWTSCRASSTAAMMAGGCGVAAAGATSNIPGTLWAAGPALGLQWRFLGSGLRLESTVTPSWMWLVTPAGVANGFGAQVSLGLETRLGLFGTFVELGYTFGWLTNGPVATPAPSLNGLLIVAGMRI